MSLDSILNRKWKQLYLEVEGEEWEGLPSQNPFYLWYWAKRNKHNQKDPRIPTDNDIEHAKRLEMLRQAVKKHKENTGDENAKLVVLRFRDSDVWWVSNHTVSV